MPNSPDSPILEICYGPMKSGKSRYLIEKAEELKQRRQSFLAFKPLQDTRDGSYIRSRDRQCRDIQALPVHKSQQILDFVRQAQSAPQQLLQTVPFGETDSLSIRDSFLPGQPLKACLIDEAFLLDSALLKSLQSIKDSGVSVFMSGLDRDFRGEYFPLAVAHNRQISMKEIIDSCDHALALMAFCQICQQPAALTQRLIDGQPAPYNSPTVLIGDEEYQPRCREHHRVSGRPESLTAVS